MILTLLAWVNHCVDRVKNFFLFVWRFVEKKILKNEKILAEVNRKIRNCGNKRYSSISYCTMRYWMQPSSDLNKSEKTELSTCGWAKSQLLFYQGWYKNINLYFKNITLRHLWLFYSKFLTYLFYLFIYFSL